MHSPWFITEIWHPWTSRTYSAPQLGHNVQEPGDPPNSDGLCEVVMAVSSSATLPFSVSSSSSFACVPTYRVFPRLRPPRALSFRHLRASHPYYSQLSSYRRDVHGSMVPGDRNWSRSSIGDFAYEEDDDSEDESEDRSLDLLVRFVQNVFKKISKSARKAVRSVLPASISTQLVGFSVNGVILLAFLWFLKAFLEVVCTFGSLVFVSILLIRGIWSGISYMQENRNNNVIDDSAWTNSQPAG